MGKYPHKITILGEENMSDLAITVIFIIFIAIFTVGYNYVITKIEERKDGRR